MVIVFEMYEKYKKKHLLLNLNATKKYWIQYKFERLIQLLSHTFYTINIAHKPSN